MNKEIMITDLSCCTPSTSLCREPKHSCWQMVDYKTDDGLEGIMLYATPESHAGEITLPLDTVGEYEIYIGINYPRAALGDVLHYTQWPLYGTVWMKLANDKGFSRFCPEIPWRQDKSNKTGSNLQIWRSIYETYWKTADLKGQSLIISPPKEPYNIEELRQVANISYVRLVKLSEDRQKTWRDLQSNDSTKRLAAQFCTGELSGHTSGSPAYHPTEKQWMYDTLEPYLNNDLGIICFEAIRGNYCLFNTKAGDCGSEDGHWRQEWINPLATAVEIGKEHGVSILAGLRMIGAAQPPVRNPIQNSKFYWQNQQWSKRDPQGRPGSNLSIAFPEVREYWISLIREALNYGCDGIHLLFDRCWPFVYYEEPSLSAFKDEYGIDGRDVATDDPRWIEHQCMFVNQFLREIRTVLDEKPDRKLAVHVLCAEYGSWELRNPRNAGCDVERWIKEKLVDYIMPTPAGGPDMCEHIERFKELAGNDVKIYPDLFPRTQPAEDYARLAKMYYQAGADGFIFRDCERRTPRASEWAVACRLGHKNMLCELEALAPGYFKRVGLDEINGLSVNYSFNDG